MFLNNFLMLSKLAKPSTSISFCRGIALKKRFYKKCNIVGHNGSFEIALDQRKLKTPQGTVVRVDSEALAVAVAAEWDFQTDKIVQSNMHLTGLCFTAIDNPDKLTEEKIANELVNYIDADTILYNDDNEEQDDLYQKQKAEWLPISEWLCERYNVNIRPTQNITGPIITQEDRQKIKQYLLSYNIWALIGYRFSIEALKSVSLGLACANRLITPEKASKLSRLEEDYQAGRWGRVEWSHDLNEQSTISRVAAGTFFIHANSSQYLIKSKRAQG